MGDRYEIHGRLVERRGGVIMRDETRLIRADSFDAAQAVGRALADGGMVAWVFAVSWEPDRTSPTYRTVAHLHPAVSGSAGRAG